MNLNEKQAVFCYNICSFVVRCKDELGIDLIGAEYFRTPEQAKIYAKSGKGIANSNHRKKLAWDLFVCKNGKVSWAAEEYDACGALWKTCHPLARYGGDFKGRDRVHFSFEHNGVK